MLKQYLLPAVFAFCLTFFLTWGSLYLFPKLGLMDRPVKYGLKRKPIPYYGGLVLFICFVVSVFVFVKIDRHVAGLLLGAVLIAAVSFIDDLRGLSPWIRLFVQVLGAVVLVFSGIGIHSISNPFGVPLSLDALQMSLTLDHVYQIAVLSALFTIIWVVAIVNTMNWLDGLNGLTSGITVIAALTLFLLSIRPGIHYDVSSQVPVAMMSVILFAVALAFWLFDFFPAKILMGDTGSMFFGFLLASLAIFSGGKVATAFLVLGFPILDAIWVILRRILEGKSPMKGDRKHLHHRLLEIGLGERKALLLIYALCAVFGGIAVFLEGTQKVYAIAAMLVLMVALGFVAVKLGKKKAV
jgi:UDP-GlcNAc:undecaprenyl-phosphate/decaprenyl-phosphate GlcNAc-1-phosphate transferase